MKTLFNVLAAAALLVAGGCVSAPVPPADRRVTIARDLGCDLYVTDVRCVKVKRGPYYNFQANVVNNTASQLPVEWKVQWLDGDGVEIESLVSGWQAFVLAPNEVKGLSGVAPSPDAADMRFYVRRGR